MCEATDPLYPHSSPMSRDPTIGVAMSAFNQGHLVAESIESLLDQTRRPDRIVVVDDGSTDDTTSVVSRYEEHGVNLIRLKRRGVSEVLNTAAVNLETDYLAIQAADDVSRPERLEVELDAAETDGSLLVTSLPTVIDENSRTVDDKIASEFFTFPGDEVPLLRRLFKTGNLLCASSAFIRLDAFKMAGGFHPRLLHLQDHWLWVRLAGLGSVTRLGDRLVCYRRDSSGGNLSNPGNDHRMRVELGYCYRHFFDLASDERFIESFGDLLVDKGHDRALEEALLLFRHTDPLAQQAGIDRLLELATDRNYQRKLEELGLGPFEFFDAAGGVDVDRLKERTLLQAAHDEVVEQRDAVQAAHDEVLGSFSYRVLRPVRFCGSRVRWLWKRGRA